MKIILFGFLLLLLTLPKLTAQSSWSAGMGVHPFLYWYSNRTDKMYLPPNYRINYPDSFIPNGWQIGIPAQYQYSDKVFFQAALEWSSQQMSYHKIQFIKPPTEDRTTFISRLDYIKLPIMSGLKYNFTYGNHFLYGMIGPQLLFLTTYRDVYELYSVTFDTNSIGIAKNGTLSVNTTSLDGMTIITDNYFEVSPWKYKRFVLGGVTEIGINLQLADKYRLFAGVRGEADLSGIDNLTSQIMLEDDVLLAWYGGTRTNSGNEGNKRTHSYQFRLGIHAGILYEF